MSPDEPVFLNNLMWLTPSSCDAPPIHWYFGQIRMLQATRHAFISISHYPGRVWLVFIEISVANLIHWSGLVVCCCFAWWQWSSFIHDTDYCDNLNTESREASHWSHVHNEWLWLVVTLPFAFPAHATRHGAPMIRLSLSRSEIRRESSQEILST